MDQIGAQTLPTGTGYEWTAMSYQEKAVGSQIYFVFGLALLLVYFVLAGQYESWILPLSVILGVPLALLGTVGALIVLGVANNLYTQIGLILLIALGSKNAILIVEYARQKRAEGMKIVEAAVEGARLRFRPILMTSFAFILGVFPLVIATGAGAGARRSIGIAVFSGMIASTCLAVVFVPSFYVVMQRIEEWRVAPASAAAAGAMTRLCRSRRRVSENSHNLDAGRAMLGTVPHRRRSPLMIRSAVVLAIRGIGVPALRRTCRFAQDC